jgi:threonine dehydrogenase-like Zn-dependent dehydrogenase
MRAITFHAPGDLHCESVPDPRLVAPTDAVVRVEVAAICGSDLHVYRGNEAGLDSGTVMGHEFLGEVVETGDGVHGLEPGDRVVSPFTTSCGACPSCDEGLTARCEHGELFGWVEGGHGLHGVQAEYVRVPLADATLVKVPVGLASEAALLAGDVLSTGFFCADAARLDPGATVVVLGCGPVGLMAVVGAQELGAGKVLAIDSVPERLELARRMGAEPVDLAGDPLESVREHTDGRGADCVLEVVGSPAASRLALDLLRPGGTISAVGVHTETSFAFSPGEAYDKNLTYVAGRCPARHYAPRMLELLEAGRYPIEAIYSHRLTLEEGPRGYEIFDGKLEGCTKVLLTP